MEEHKESDRLKVAAFFSDVCRNTGKVSFKITYTNTDGNRDIDQRFQDFCFKYANNEYLQGINKLLDIAKAYQDRVAMENYMKMLEQRIIVLENKGVEIKKEDKKETKTF